MIQDQVVYFTDEIRDIVLTVQDKEDKNGLSLLDKLQQVDPLITGIRFEYGNLTEVKNRLDDKNQSAKTDKYPLIILLEDYKINNGQRTGILGNINCNILIVYETKAEYTRVQREEISFRPVLYPIYFALMRHLKLSGKFQIYDESRIIHDCVPHPHFGRPGQYKNEAYLLGDPVDAIGVENLFLDIYLNNCV